MRDRLLPLLAAAALIAGCMPAAKREPKPEPELPARWAPAPAGARTVAEAGGWKLFGDPALERLIEEALAHNASLALAVARVDEARATLAGTAAERMPSVSAGVDANRSRTSQRGSFPLPAGVDSVRNNVRAAVNVSYELDLWGRLARATDAARADLLQTEAARDTVRIALVADVVQGYYTLRSLDAQVAVTQRAIASRLESLAIQQRRFALGDISEFDIRAREAEVAAAQAQLPQLERSRALAEGALAVLLGRSPRAILESPVVAGSGAMPAALAPVVPADMPSELLLRRPDLVEAEQRLAALDARIDVARASLFPSIALTGYLGSESTTLADLFTGPAGIWRLATAITQPIWQAGRLQAQVEVVEARRRQAVAQYQRAVQLAFREVRDALASQREARAALEAETRRAEALAAALKLARVRYEGGVATQLDVLDAERALLAAEINRVDALRSQRAAIADLVKALGGGWQ